MITVTINGSTWHTPDERKAISWGFETAIRLWKSRKTVTIDADVPDEQTRARVIDAIIGEIRAETLQSVSYKVSVVERSPEAVRDKNNVIPFTKPRKGQFELSDGGLIEVITGFEHPDSAENQRIMREDEEDQLHDRK
ncbi:hypothetical protein [Methylobacterium sp. WSM2598]|uniref:hypothetical protein n=1 Tax=Methylobacterium sp. WSM2598 TaxID=398261 RepID=UPI00037F661D|nr:hypothetical protein [Methylobacterium sp. WSM2598]